MLWEAGEARGGRGLGSGELALRRRSGNESVGGRGFVEFVLDLWELHVRRSGGVMGGAGRGALGLPRLVWCRSDGHRAASDWAREGFLCVQSVTAASR